MDETAIAVWGLRAGYGPAGYGRDVLRGVDLELQRGEMVGLLGPNGGGKTTLLRCLAGTLRPTAGRVTLLGSDLTTWTRGELARRVAVMPQTMALPDGFRVGELVAMGRTPHAVRVFGMTPDDEAAVERALREADVSELAARHPAELSGGERQRVLVAMALAQEPDVLLLDEPTLHLDVAHQAALLATIDALRRRRGIAVLAVLHDLNLATSFVPRVALLHSGRIVGDGPPASVLRADVVRDVFGVAMDEALTADGRRYLVPHGPLMAAEA